MKKINSIAQNVRSFFKKYSQSLEVNYPGINVQIIMRYLFDEFSKGEDLFIYQEQFLSEDEAKFLNYLLTGAPIEYYFKRAYFYDSYFFVNEKVLIPRQETELLVEMALKYVNNSDVKSICEIGVGSGAIGLSIIKELKKIANNKSYSFLLTDICDDALEVCKSNAHFLSLLSQDIDPNKDLILKNKSTISFLQTDRLFGVKSKFDLILSNPPYIKEQADLSGVHNQVHLFEPHKALYLPDNTYLEWFEIFFKQVKLCLNTKGRFFMEGHEDHLKSLMNLALEIGFSKGIVHQDLTHRDRFLELFN